METLYAKLYEKYTTLKKKKFSELDEINREQEDKFLTFVSASDALTKHLRTENQDLKKIVERLRNENTEMRFTRDEERLLSQKRLVEEELKNKALSEQVKKLKELISQGVDQSGSKRKTPESPQVTMTSIRKRSRQSEDNMVETDMGALVVSQPQCCTRTDEGSSNSVGCPFQALGEQLIGMKLSTKNDGERVCIVASHPSSGLSFSLTLMNNSTGEEAELLYNVVSLGTFERVVPEWMRDVIKFHTSMTPVFFERVSRVIKPRG